MVFYRRDGEVGQWHIPDFMLLGPNEYVEVGQVMREDKVKKMAAFVSAGNVLHHIRNIRKIWSL